MSIAVDKNVYFLSIVVDKIGYILHDMTRIIIEFGARVVGICKMGEFAVGEEAAVDWGT